MRDPKGPVKAYKTPKELAKKHNVSLETIMKQVEIGTKVEGEHTTSKSAAKITALQHIDEIPDYYTKLKKVEKSTKTEQMGESKFCRLCRKFETQEECSYGPTMWSRYTQEPLSLNQMKYNSSRPHPANESKILDEKRGLWDNIHARRKKGLPPKKPGEKGYPKTLDIEEDLKQARKNVGASKCWPGKVAKGTKMKNGKEVPNCVPEQYSNWREELALNPTEFEFIDLIKPDPLKPSKGIGSNLVNEDWQSVNRKDKTDGLSQKAVNAYRHENPGSKLQTAVTEKNPSGKRASRRKSFCSRMSGMKSKLTSSKTANDPDSRINKALRRWRCR